MFAQGSLKSGWYSGVVAVRADILLDLLLANDDTAPDMYSSDTHSLHDENLWRHMATKMLEVSRDRERMASVSRSAKDSGKTSLLFNQPCTQLLLILTGLSQSDSIVRLPFNLCNSPLIPLAIGQEWKAAYHKRKPYTGAVD